MTTTDTRLLHEVYDEMRMALTRIAIMHEAVCYDYPGDEIPGLTEEITKASQAAKGWRAKVGDHRSMEEVELAVKGREMGKSIEQLEVDRINGMTREEMCRLRRNAPTGHPYFDAAKPYYDAFKARFDNLGGFSPAISKAMGIKLNPHQLDSKGSEG